MASAATPGPVAAYSFDEGEAAGTTIEDQAGENDGTLEGVGRTPHGRYGGALSFHNNEGECASVPDSESLQLNEEFTIESWVKSDSLVSEPIVYKETEGYWSYWFGIALGEEGRPEANIADEGGEEWNVRSPTSIEAGVWTHLAVTYDGAHMRLYVDGAEVATKAVPGAMLASEGPLWIGCAPPNHETFDGRIDELRIYDRVLGQPEVAADMESPIETPKAGPVAEYSFDGGEAAGTTLEDLAGENDGTIEGAKWTTGRYGDALSFAGPEDCVTIPDSDSLQLGEEATVEAWVKPTGTLASDPIAFKESAGNYSYAMGLGFTHEGRAEGWIRYEGEEEEVYSPSAVEVGVWSHLALTYDGSRLRIYVDGKLAASHKLPEPDATLSSEGPLHIGCAPAYNENFRGRIDEVRLYERALGEGEVLGDMEAPIQTPRQGPVAEYSFDGGEAAGTTLEDLAGENDGTIEGGAAWGKGRYGDSLEFDNEEGECVSVPNSAALGLGEELTIEAWVKSDSLVSEPIVYKETEGYWSYWFGIALGEEGRPEANIADEGGEEWNVRSPYSIEAGVWTHLAVTYDGAHMRLFVDGKEVATKAVPGAVLASEGPLWIGCAPPNHETFNGRIDELRIYQRALGPAEVAADMEAPIQTPKAGPVAEYSFDEDKGGIVEDQAGENDGTVEGAEWTEHGRYGGAMEFDAAKGDVITVPDSESLRLSEEFTLEAWVRPDEGRPQSPVLGKAAAGQYGYGLWANGDEGSNLHPMGFISNDQYVNSHAYSGTNLPTKAWSHLAVTDDGAHIRLYVDGELVDERESEEVATGTGPLQIGGDEPVAEGGLFDGRIDEVRIYDRGLDAAEVGADMEAPIQTPKQGPIAAWSFEEGEGSTVEDVTGDEHDGTIEGAEWARGKYGEGLKFDGENDVVKVPSSTEFALTEGFTLEAWVRPESESNEWAPILAKEMGGGEATNELAWWLYEGDWNSDEPFGGTEPSPGVRDEAHADDPLPINVWSHVALTYDGAQVRLYVDGELVDCSPVPAGPPPVTEGELQIGAATEHGDYFSGRIDEVRIYDRSLSAQELDPNWIPDTNPPEIEFKGSLTEGLKAGTTKYSLDIDARDGDASRREAGIKTVTVSVDGASVDSFTQRCRQTNCSMEEELPFDTDVYGFESHEVVVEAIDQSGNSAIRILPVAAPNGSIPACSTSGVVESPADEVETLAGGGTNAIYHGAEGERISFRSAPAGFDPRSATAEELERYGFPHRPPESEASARKAWERTVGRASGTAQPGGCMMTESPEFATRIPRSVSPTQAGYYALDPEGPEKHWRAARSLFVQPGVTKTCPNEAALSTWVGVGGLEDKGFFQAGTTTPYGYYDAESHERLFNASAFTEFFRAGHEKLKHLREDEEPAHINLAIKPHQTIFALAEWLPAKEAMRMYVQNLNTGFVDSMEIEEKESRVYDGQALQFVAAERSEELQNFGAVSLVENEGFVDGEGWTSLANLGHLVAARMQAVREEKPVGQVMASVGGLFGGEGAGVSFTSVWHHCHQ